MTDIFSIGYFVKSLLSGRDVEVYMANEYKIVWQKPVDYQPVNLMRALPSPISRQMTEIYNYSIVEDGFYFIDNLEDERVAGYALKLFLDEALIYTNQVEVKKL